MTNPAIDPTLIQPGMEVFTSEGDRVGRVQEIREGYLLVERSNEPQLFVPFAFLLYVSNNLVTLTVPTSRVNEMGWDRPRM